MKTKTKQNKKEEEEEEIELQFFSTKLVFKYNIIQRETRIEKKKK
jgi:hypothetical protein